MSDFLHVRKQENIKIHYIEHLKTKMQHIKSFSTIRIQSVTGQKGMTDNPGGTRFTTHQAPLSKKHLPSN